MLFLCEKFNKNPDFIGYNVISVRYNTEVHTNNFVLLHVKNTSGCDFSDIRAKLEKCNELGIEVNKAEVPIFLDFEVYVIWWRIW